MTEVSEMANQSHSAEGHGDDHHGTHSTQYYVKIWGILVVLLIVSIIGPELGIQVVTLITAFGIAIVKAYMVAKYFMHLDIEKTYIVYLLVTCVAFLGLFFAGVSPDVLKHEGHNWENRAAKEHVAKELAKQKASESAPAVAPKAEEPAPATK